MTKVKVDARMIEKIKELRIKGKKQEEISVEVGVTQGTVSQILRGSGLGGQLVRR
jgi:transcriptional regulator with XRE-family HTH domain